MLLHAKERCEVPHGREGAREKEVALPFIFFALPLIYCTYGKLVGTKRFRFLPIFSEEWQLRHTVEMKGGLTVDMEW